MKPDVTKPRNAPLDRQQLIFLCGLGTVLAAAALGSYHPEPLARLDYRAYDAMVGWARTDPPTGRVVIVDVDERSLSAFGQWPWRRDLLGRFIARIRESGAAVIALDVVFAEPDRTEPSADTLDFDLLQRQPRDSPGTGRDAAFADTLRAGRVVVGYAFTFQSPSRQSSPCVLHPLGLAIERPAGEGEAFPLFHASDALCSLPSLAQAAGTSGFLNAVPDSDGILRRVPLLIEFDGRVYPGLALAAVLLTSNTREIALRVGTANATTLLVGNRSVALDAKGNLLLRYRGKKNTFPYVSAADVMRGGLASDVFRDRIVLVGATALGTREAVTTPLDTLFAGVEVQATVADNLLGQDFISRPELASFAESVATIVLGIVIAFLIAKTGPAWGSLGVIACLAALWGGAEWALSTKRVFLSPVTPTLGGIAAFGVMLLAGFVRERRRADRASVDRAVARHLMIQSLLSLSEIRDADTGRHSRRTQQYVRTLAEQLSAHPRFRGYLTPDRIDLLATLAPLHDIGKVGVPDQLLNKPGRLTADEITEMRKHPSYAREVIERAERQVGVQDDDILAMVKEIVYTHHEWWDGHGYPNGLQGEQIPVPGRVVTLVDVYDALTTRRVYRQAMSHDTVVNLIVEGRGTQFDPAVVDAFLQVAPDFRGISVEYVTVDARSAAL